LTGGKTLVVAQVALCALLMSVAGLLAHTLTNLKGFDAGFARKNMLLFNLEAPRELAVPARLTFYEEVRERLRSLPGVAAVAYSSRSPVDFSMNTRPFRVPGAPALRNDGVSANIVAPGYFDLFGIRVLRGRGLAEEDRAAGRPVAVIDETVARQFFGDADPLGRTVLLGADQNRLEIVGVVASAREELRDLPPPTIYTPVAQTPVDADGGGGIPRRVTMEILTTGNPGGQAAAARREVRLVNREAVLTYVRTMEQQVNSAIVRERILASVSVGFGILAVLLAAVGLYGTMAYGVARRSREIGLRMALGATQSAMRWRVVRETLLLSVAGVVIGLAAALGTTKVVSSFLFGLSPRDPATLAGVAGILLAIGLAAGYFPGKRAAAVDPMQTLRAE
jgi:predicted permease